MRRTCLVLSAATLLVFSLGAGAPLLSSEEAQTVSPTTSSGPAIDYHPDNRTLSVHLNGLPLNQVMEELSKQTHIRFRPPEPDKTFDNRPVMASFERMPIERAIKQLLGPSNTAMLYETDHHAGGTTPQLMEVRVLDLGVIPVVATQENPSRPQTIFTPEQLQSRREAIQKRREERQARSNTRRSGERRGNGGSTNQDASQNSGNQPSDQPPDQSSVGQPAAGSQPAGGQSSGNGGQPSSGGSNAKGNGGKQ